VLLPVTLQWTVSRARGTWNGQEYVVTWWPSTSERRRAVFAPIATGTLVDLQYVEYWYLDDDDGRGIQTDEDPELEDVPDELLTLMRKDGVTPAREAAP